jgi:hypothetical protein
MVRPCSRHACQRPTLDWGCITRSAPMSKTAGAQIAAIGIDIGENSFHVVGFDLGEIIGAGQRQKQHLGQRI